MAEYLKGLNFEEELRKVREVLDIMPSLSENMVINMGSEPFERYWIKRVLERAFLLGRAEVLEKASTGDSLKETPSYGPVF